MDYPGETDKLFGVKCSTNSTKAPSSKIYIICVMAIISDHQTLRTLSDELASAGGNTRAFEASFSFKVERYIFLMESN